MVNRQVEERAQDKERVARQALADCDQARGELFQAQAKLDRFHVKETSWTEGRKEAEQMKKQLVLQGELLERYKERLAQLPVAGREEEKRILQEAANNEVTAAKNELLWKQQELTATKARVEELEAKVLTLQGTVTRQEE